MNIFAEYEQMAIEYQNKNNILNQQLEQEKTLKAQLKEELKKTKLELLTLKNTKEELKTDVN